MSWISFATSDAELTLRVQTRSDAPPTGWRVCLRKHLVERRQIAGAGHADGGTSSCSQRRRSCSSSEPPRRSAPCAICSSARASSRRSPSELPRRTVRRLRDEHQRERSAEADGQAERWSSGLVARRAEDRVCDGMARQPRPLRHERRRERAAEADARPGERRRAAWSPDGRKIAFTKAHAPAESRGPWESDVYVINVDGSGERNLTRRRRERRTVWSPDGQKIAFTSRRDASGRGAAPSTS